nr:uncharacterized mitochondrial protein AtMg00810-like [Nicotiana tomentosiformis]
MKVSSVPIFPVLEPADAADVPSIHDASEPTQGELSQYLPPLECNQRLITTEFDEAVVCTSADDNILVLSQFMHKPKRSHMDAALRVIKYVKNAPGLGLLMSSEGSNNLVAYCNSDWATCPQSRKSVTCYLVKFGNSLVSWKSKKHNIISRSSTEVEFRSMASTVAELSWLVGLFQELGVTV